MKIVKIETQTLKFEQVEYETPTAKDFAVAEKIAGVSVGHKYNLALISRCCKFDGQKLPMEELEKLSGEDFLDLSLAVLGGSPKESDQPSSTSQGTEE